MVAGRTYTISCSKPYDINNFNLYFRIYHTDGTYSGVTSYPTTFIAKDGDYITGSLWVDEGTSFNVSNVSIQIELGDTATEYEPYSGTTTRITPDINPYNVQNDIRQQEGINNVSISAGEVSVTGVKRNAAVKKIWDNKADLSDIPIDTVSDTAGIVTLDGLQGGVPFSQIMISGGNRIDLTNRSASSTSTSADGDSSSLTIARNATAEANWTYVEYKVYVTPNTDYYIKCTAETENGVAGVSVMQSDKSSFSPSVYKWGGNDFNISFNSRNNEFVYVRFYSNASSTAMTSSSVTYHNIMLSEDENAEYVPEIIGQEITLTACGKNLIPYPYHMPSGININGITYVINDDGSITANGTATERSDFYIKVDLPIKKGLYTLSGCPYGGKIENTTYYVIQAYGDTLYTTGNGVLDTGNAAEINATEDFIIKRIMIRILKGTVCNNLVFYPQIEVGSSATEYELYNGSTTTIAPDSNPYTVPNDIRQQEGINNVSVSVGKISVTGVKKSPVINRAWEELDNHTNNTTVHVTAEEKAAWNAVNYSNPNLLINPDFAVNQRGKSDYTTGFSVDCWKCNNITLNANGGTITLTKADGISQGELVQRVEGAYKLLAGKTVTISCADVDGNIIKGTATIPAEQPAATTNLISASSGNVWITFSWSVTGYFYFRIWLRGNAALTYSPAWCKVEIGSLATPFVPPNHAEELLKIQSMNDDGTSKLVSNDTLPTIMNSQMVSNPNLLINPDFRINQRGFVSGSAGTGGFCIDRWLIGAGETFTYNDDGTVTIECTASAGRNFSQTIKFPNYLSGKEMTLSVEVTDFSGDVALGYDDGTGLITSYIKSTGIITKTFSPQVTRGELSVSLVPKVVGSYATIRWIKLEAGAVATPFAPPDTATELLKIQSMSDDGTPKLISNSTLPTIMNSQMVSNPNLLINPNFKINQRGQSEYTGSKNYLYTVDCWRVGFSNGIAKSLKVESDGVVFGSTTDKQYLVQLIENSERLIGDYTLTFCVSEITGSAVIQFIENNVASSSAVIRKPGVYSVTITLSGTGATVARRVQLQSEVGSTVKVRWAKLESGSIATPFCPPDPATELAKCQRYYEILTIPTKTPIIGVRVNNLMLPTITYSVPKRIDTPTVLADEAYPVRFSDNAGVFGALVKKAFTGFYCTSSSMTGFFGDIQENKIDAGQMGYIADPIKIIINAEL